MDSFGEGHDLSDYLYNYWYARESLDSEEFKGWWSGVRESSSLVIRKEVISWDAWSYLINILTKADVSGIDHLVLKLPDSRSKNSSMLQSYGSYAEDFIKADNQLGAVLATGRFSALKTLRILVDDFELLGDSTKLGQQLAKALRIGQFRNLQKLSLPTWDFSAVLEALIEGDVCHLTSLSLINVLRRDVRRRSTIAATGRLGATLRSGYMFESLQHLHFDNLFPDDWTIFTIQVKCGKLPRLTSLCIRNSSLRAVNLADLVGSRKWFNSLQDFSMGGCGITSKQVCSLLDKVMDIPNIGSKTQLALKSLDLHSNELDLNAVIALISLAESGRLLQLQKLDLSNNVGLRFSGVLLIHPASKCMRFLISQTGSLPSLQKLNWETNGVVEADVEAIVEAYYWNPALTAEIHITWDQVYDRLLKTKLKAYRDRNVRHIALREELGEDLGNTIPLSYAKVFLCGFAEVGKTTLRRSLVRDFRIWTKFMWESRLIKEPRTRGIEVSRIEAKKSNGDTTTLALWDLSGQEEYHVLHGSFLADLGFEGGKATMFVFVFKASFEPDLEDKPRDIVLAQIRGILFSPTCETPCGDYSELLQR